MITDALIAHLKASLSITSIYVERAPLDAGACIVIDDNGDVGDRYWRNGQTETGLREQEYELTVWADLSEGGAKYADQVAREIIALLDNYGGPFVDNAVSPAVNHRVSHIEASNGGGGFDAGPERYAHSVFLTVMYE